MPDANALRLPGRGLHPSHYSALRTEILRTGAELSHEQLLDLTDGLQRLSRRGRAMPRYDARLDVEPRVFA